VQGRPLLQSISLSGEPHELVAVVGVSGAGKSTLLRLIQGEIAPESGSIGIPKRWRIGGVAQEAPGNDVSLIDTVLAADTERSALLAEELIATDPHRIAEIQTRLGDIDAHTAPAPARPAPPPGGFAGLPPKKNGDFAWVQHMIYHLSARGRAGALRRRVGVVTREFKLVRTAGDDDQGADYGWGAAPGGRG